MAEPNRANNLRRVIGGGSTSGRNVSMLDDNIRAIQRLVETAARDGSGIISVYRPLDDDEIRELSKTEKDEIANAYHVELNGDDRVYYITYKPQVKKNKGGKLEHLNRSTPFVQALLDKIGSEYSFLYSRSRVRSLDQIELPKTQKGFSIAGGEPERLEGKNKYELYFLIECKDNIDTNEKLTNIIDRVLIDVNENTSADELFGNMTYAPLEYDTDYDEEMPVVEEEVQAQLNSLILGIREKNEVRRRILDFLIDSRESDLYAHLSKRNEEFLRAKEADKWEINALNSTVTCRMMPIGVFLNSVENVRIPFTVEEKTTRERATFFVDINPTVRFEGYTCPHCGRPVGDGNGLVLARTPFGAEVGCEACASKCTHVGCKKYAFDDGGCVVCGKILCPDHSLKSIDSDDRLCHECAQVFRDSKSRKPLSPSDAAVRDEDENFVRDFVRDNIGKSGRLKPTALDELRKRELLRKRDCVRCRTRSGYKYYLKKETGKCGECGESFYVGDLLKDTVSGKMLCPFDRVDCPCGNVTRKADAHLCSHDGCNRGFCAECFEKMKEPKGYFEGVKRANGRLRAVKTEGKLYCSEHIAVCKICGKTIPLSEAKKCRDCGGTYCSDCGEGSKCLTCAKASSVNEINYKDISSPSRKYRLNALPFRDKFGMTAVMEDNEEIVFVTLRKFGATVLRRYSKLTQKMTAINDKKKAEDK